MNGAAATNLSALSNDRRTPKHAGTERTEGMQGSNMATRAPRDRRFPAIATEEFRRRVKTQGSLASEDAALVLLFSLFASGQIKLLRIDGGRKITAVLSQHREVAA